MKDKEQKLQKVRKEINDKYGKGSIMPLSELPVWEGGISTGSIGLDKAIGGVGYPLGKMIEVAGKYSSGKTTLALHAIAAAQKDGKPGLFIDMERALDIDYAEKLGVNTSQMLVAYPPVGEHAIDIANKAMGDAGIVVIDSVPALVPRQRFEGEIEDKNYGDIAHLLSRSLPVLKGTAANTGAVLIFLNQMRADQKGYSNNPNHEPMKTYGGHALRHFADVRIGLWPAATKKELRKTQQLVRATVEKNKSDKPKRVANLVIEYGKGIDAMLDLVTVAVDMDIIEKKGSWYEFKALKGHGLANFAEGLFEDMGLADEIKKAVLT